MRERTDVSRLAKRVLARDADSPLTETPERMARRVCRELGAKKNVEKERLFGAGIGWVDAHLLASARLSGCLLWTLDKPLRKAAAALRLAA